MIYPELFNHYCNELELRLTSLRKALLFILWSAKKPLKAYEIIEQLVQLKVNAKPPSVYRVLDYFVLYGLVHKLESIQSYTLCHEPEKRLPSEILMVCNHCHQVREIYNPELRQLIEVLSVRCQFYLGQDAIELKGFCLKCRESGCAFPQS